MPVEPQAPYISSKDAAKKYGLTNDHIGLLCRRGKIQGLLWGRVWYISEPSIQTYIQKSAELKEARKHALSQQWRAAWTTAFIGFSLFSFTPHNTAAKEYVSIPIDAPTPEPLLLSLLAAVGELDEIKNSIPVPVVPAAEQTEVSAISTLSFGSLVALGFEELGEIVYNFSIPAPDKKLVRVVYAKDFVEENNKTNQIDPLSNLLATAIGKVSEVVPVLPEPEVALAAVPQAPALLTHRNIAEGIEALDGDLAAFNDAMFATYLFSAQEFAAVAMFDAAQAAHIWDKTFAALGEQFVSDMHRLGRAQATWYMSVARSLEQTYNELADATAGSTTFEHSISVASVAYSPKMPTIAPAHVVRENYVKEAEPKSVCVEDICITEEQFLEMAAKANNNSPNLQELQE